ncbi:MAG: adenylate cyclase, class 2 [Candidatus Parcubacteria bacterium]|jgi:adenylate cyclase class 2|nr:adenylate cyclase, class 2 [Candidatus Parcubacteria bacterium]
MQPDKEIEVRFLEIDKDGLIEKLVELGAKDKGEALLEEMIIYDEDFKWLEERKFIRLRKTGGQTRLAYKHHDDLGKGEATDIEFGVDDFDKAIVFFSALGYIPYRRQEKRRHTFKGLDVNFDIDTWPRIPPYVEIEGPSLAAIRAAAEAVGLDWSKANFHDARWIIENVYKIPVGKMRWFTFDRFE